MMNFIQRNAWAGFFGAVCRYQVNQWEFFIVIVIMIALVEWSHRADKKVDNEE